MNGVNRYGQNFQCQGIALVILAIHLDLEGRYGIDILIEGSQHIVSSHQDALSTQFDGITMTLLHHLDTRNQLL